MLITNAGYLGDVEPDGLMRFAVSSHDNTGACAALSFDTGNLADLWIPGQGTVLPLTTGVSLNNGGGGNVVLFDIDLASLTPFADDPEDFAIILGPVSLGLMTGIYQQVATFSIGRRRLLKALGAETLVDVDNGGMVTADLSPYDRGHVNDMFNFLLSAPAAPAYGIKSGLELVGFPFALRQSADPTLPATGVTVAAQRSLDGGAFSNCANAVSEISAGVYKITLDAADVTAARFVMLKFSGSGAITEFVMLRITP